MTIRLVDKDWAREFAEAAAKGGGDLRIVSPFIKAGVLYRLPLAAPGVARVITRFNLADFAEGVSDIAALRALLEAGVSVRGVRNLHAKLYVFADRAIVTSANLTEAALSRNLEFGFVSADAGVLETCRAYFDDLWARCGPDLTAGMLERWEPIMSRHRLSHGQPIRQEKLADFGVDVGFASPLAWATLPLVAEAAQAFVKFLGVSSDRFALSYPTAELVRRANCHRLLAYPAAKRPTGVREGAVMYIGRLTRDPNGKNDIHVFGRAIAVRHEPGRDDATDKEIARQPWLATWPRFVRVHHAEILAGSLANGISLNDLMDHLGPNSFAPTKRNVSRGSGNTDPRRAYRQQPAVEVSAEGRAWLDERFQAALETHGIIPKADLEALDWSHGA
ncbi:phospholipase D family protein [Polymorphum gilvum]|uniref:Tiorf33 protein n=1 Tax=Polymorphum gilvum (strain LMG 25793 / CGMCC 1.9160 / SL003B-26A1) TaxID=991905 RepID=F2IXD5_POLGS|nr:phospholipase D family protein [Polymorphum gilvum]ADZ70453.1 Tiorf33 protein [Polymorphum gilvum SL003B-26A1]